MAGSYNSITLIGNLGRDPESRMLPDGTQVASFSVATSERWRDRQQQQQERTTWFRVSAFGKLGETCSQYHAPPRFPGSPDELVNEGEAYTEDSA